MKAIFPILLALSMSGVVATAASAGPVWKVDGKVLKAGEEKIASLNPVNRPEIEFEQGAEKYVVACSTIPENTGLGKIIGGDPGKDTFETFAMARNSCVVTEAGVLSTKCFVRSVYLNKASNSTLGGTLPNPTDTFATFELAVEIADFGLETCPVTTGLFTMGGAITGTWSNTASKVTFNKARVTFGAFTNPVFSVGYVIRVPSPLRVTQKGGQADWLVREAALPTSSKDNALYEGSSFELKSESTTIKCSVIRGSGTITGGEPGTDVTTFTPGECSDVGASGCTVEEPIEIPNVNSTLTTLNKTKEEYGDKLEEFGTTIEIAGSSCASKGVYQLSGDVVGLENNSLEELQFTEPAQEGSTLKFGGSSATLVGKVKNAFADPTEVEEEEVLENGEWFVAGSKLSSSAALATTAKVDSSPTLKIKVGGSSIKVSCKGTILSSVSPEIRATNELKAKSLTFEGCETTEPATGCKLEGQPVSIKTEPIKATDKAGPKSPEARLTFTPQTKKALAALAFSEKNTCAFDESEPLNGAVTLKAPTGQNEEASQAIEGLGSVENNSLELAGNKAVIEGGRTLLKLTSGSKWSFR
jgi:hypothetical protein